MSNFQYSVEAAKKLVKKNKIIAGIILGITTIAFALLIVALVRDNFESPTLVVMLPFVLILWIFAFAFCIGILVDCKAREWQYKGHTISAYNGQMHHVTYVDGVIKEEYGQIWWQHTAAVRIDNDQVCVKFEPIGVYFYVNANKYQPVVKQTPEDRLLKLKRLLDAGAITYGEYENQKQKILNENTNN